MNNKSILLIDTPKNCSECCCGYNSYGEVDVCAATNKSVTKYYYRDKPEWCPLSPIPERINLRQYTDNTELNLGGIIAYQYAQGWNDCVDEIKEEN